MEQDLVARMNDTVFWAKAAGKTLSFKNKQRQILLIRMIQMDR